MLRRGLLVLALTSTTVFLLPASADAAPPSTGWRPEAPAHAPGQRDDHVIFSDPSTGQTVLFGGRGTGNTFLNDTRLWTGSDWVLQSPAASPFGVGRAGTMVAYDPRLGDPILFGGTILTPQNDVLNYADTWRWTGTNWVNIPTAHFPPPRTHGVLGYDPVSQRLILFGGGHSGGRYNDTWAFDGTDWTQLGPATSPPARDGAVMALDSVTGRLVMYGGQSSSGAFNDTWTWTGSNWQQLSPTTSPSVGYASTMTTDPSTGRPVIFGGWSGVTAPFDPYSNALWDWTGTSWVKRNVSPTPIGRVSAGMAADAQTGRLVIYGGSLAAGGVGGDTWTFGPNAPIIGWSQLSPGNTPPARRNATIAYDGSTGQVVMFGGTASNNATLSDTWIWNGTNWSNANPVTVPPARASAVMGFDERNGQLIMFGGYGGGTTYRNDTWEWTGTNWVARAPATVPTGRTGSAMTYSAEAGRLIMFGGWDGSGVNGFLNQTWQWTGTNWQSIPGTSPSARSNAEMAFDPSSGHVVLYGGNNGGANFGDTWTFAGGAWTQRSPAVTPGLLTQSSMAFDARLGSPVMFGGYNSGYKNTSYVWTGNDWSQLFPSAPPTARDGTALTYAPNTGQLLMFGGGPLSATSETWTGVVIGDTTPPSINVSHTPNGLNGWTTANPAGVTITAADFGSGLSGAPTCTDNGSPIPVSGNTPSFTASVSGQGAHDVHCTATDKDGNTASDDVTLKVDSIKPTVQVTPPDTPDGNFQFMFSEPVDIDPQTQSPPVIEADSAVGFFGQLTCPGGLNGVGRCASWRFNPDDRVFPGEYYDVYFQPVNGGLTDQAGNSMNAAFPTIRAATTVDNLDAEATYDWGSRKVKGTFGGSVLRESAGGASASYSFKGRKLTWYTMQGQDQGPAHVTITDSANPVDTVVNNYAPTTSKKVPVVFSGLSAGRHTVTIDVVGELSDPSATGAYVTVDALRVGAAAVVNTPKMTARWSEVFSPYAFTQERNAGVSLGYRGTQVSWVPLFGPNNGIARVVIDGVNMGEVDLYAPTYFFDPVTFGGLGDQRHTITIINTGQKNPSSSDTVISVDRFELP